MILNGSLALETPTEDYHLLSQGGELPIFNQSLDGRPFRILRDSSLRLPALFPIRVPEGRYFVVGDNREHSKDSRYFGTIADEDIIGRVTRIYYSAETEAYSWRSVDESAQ